MSDPPHHASLYVLILVICACAHACGFSAWCADPIDPDVDLYELFPAPYTPVPDPSPMMPPVGVQASVLSHDTIKVTWADNSLPKNQKITDNRFYTVRWKTNIPANTKVKVRELRMIVCFCSIQEVLEMFVFERPRSQYLFNLIEDDSSKNFFFFWFSSALLSSSNLFTTWCNSVMYNSDHFSLIKLW